MGDYPVSITLEPESEEYEFLTKHSDLITELKDFGPNIELSADILFGGDQEKWHTFVDVFFPEMAIQKYFGFKNGKAYVLPQRGTKDKLEDMLDFFMVRQTPGNSKPRNVIREEMLNFARSQARKQINAPPVVVAARPRVRRPGRGARAFAAQQARQRYMFGNRGSNNFSNNNNNNNGSEPSVNSRPEIRVNNNGEYENNNNNNNGSNTSVPSRARPMTLGNFLPPRLSRRTHRNKSLHRRNRRRSNTRRTNRR